mmetsp:Transcript_8095/g.21974  ORF Transcript_8095/g.21974 Transcript_8095/m.21974 type:complete len:240 (-) Transcript_8095:73-792(-)|eukprot:CAMPEP_0171184818 /NCGR_PEP_ID=MMETSP0790-20130122/15979_1 /TAXON_ID=2925 /ORGANISM="Alexandrium catenella, Strain OF101" /LENGTH=239 /DNA_ID=CAMNT_0011649815 /DNA_START=44 /DNA_END=763 /DNA_ORIENTATION=+
MTEVAPAAVASKEEQNRLAKWRLVHGETIHGLPFYANPAFAKWCEAANAAQQASAAKQADKAQAAGLPELTPAAVEEMHVSFVNALDGDFETLEAWKRFSNLVRDSAKIQGALDAPLKDTGERAVHRAAEQGRVKNLRWLHENGADLTAFTATALALSEDATASLSLSPAHVAAMFNQTVALAFLKSIGVDLGTRRPDGITPLDLAIEQGRSEAAQWLGDQGCVPTKAFPAPGGTQEQV